jgi:hypothetical protein
MNASRTTRPSAGASFLPLTEPRGLLSDERRLLDGGQAASPSRNQAVTASPIPAASKQSLHRPAITDVEPQLTTKVSPPIGPPLWPT